MDQTPAPVPEEGDTPGFEIPEIKDDYKYGNQIMQLEEVVVAVRGGQDSVYTVTSRGALTVVDTVHDQPIHEHLINDGQKFERKGTSVTAMDVEGSNAYFGLSDGSVLLWSVDQGMKQQMWKDHSLKVSSLRVSGTNVYTTGHDGYFRVHNLEYNTVIHSFITCTCPLSAMVLEAPHLVYIGSWDGQLKLLDLRAKSCSYILKPQDHSETPIRALALTAAPPRAAKAGGKKAAAAAPADEHPFLLLAAHGIGDITAWDMRQTSTTFMDTYAGHTDVVNCLAVDNNKIYSGADDRTVRVFDLHKGILLDTLTGHHAGINCMDIVDGHLWTGGFDRGLRKYKCSSVDSAIAVRNMRAEEEKKQAMERWLADQEAASKKKKGKKASKGKKKKK